jgi:hypothetical protein
MTTEITPSTRIPLKLAAALAVATLTLGGSGYAIREQGKDVEQLKRDVAEQKAKAAANEEAHEWIKQSLKRIERHLGTKE